MAQNVTPAVAGPRAIQTRYGGCHFRSRLEARWAVFFDAAGIAWEYEPQGFEARPGCRYLPDFYLPDVTYSLGGQRGCWVEVKGSDQQLREDSRRIGAHIDYRATPIWEGLLILGPVPRTDLGASHLAHWFLSWNKGVDASLVTWSAPFEDQPVELFMVALGVDNTSEDVPSQVSVLAKPMSISSNPLNGALTDRVVLAYDSARSARFEFGRSGAT